MFKVELLPSRLNETHTLLRITHGSNQQNFKFPTNTISEHLDSLIHELLTLRNTYEIPPEAPF